MDNPNNIPMTPGSGKIIKKQLNMSKFKEYFPEKEKFQTFSYVLGISGGDCSGKKQLIHYMFDNKDGEWFIHGTDKKVAIVHQDYFKKDHENKFSSIGTNWDEFQKAIMNLIVGNPVTIKNAKLQGKDIKIQPAGLLLIEGSHIFMQKHPIVQHISSKIFIDSDADVRVSRRIYKDTQDDGKSLNQAIQNYLSKIKPSYEQQIEPCKIKSDIIIPHFGGGYDDHRKQNKKHYESNIGTARALLLAHIRQQLALHKQQMSQKVEN